MWYGTATKKNTKGQKQAYLEKKRGREDKTTYSLKEEKKEKVKKKGTLGYNKEMKEEKGSGVIINHLALGQTIWFYGEENVGSWKEKLKYDFF